jgi:hypothetical protein
MKHFKLNDYVNVALLDCHPLKELVLGYSLGFLLNHMKVNKFRAIIWIINFGWKTSLGEATWKN